MPFYAYIILGLIQGLAEFLPVSSSGHLVIIKTILDIEKDIAYDIVLHIATLLAVLIFFRKDFLEILKGISGKSKIGIDFLKALAIGSLPTAIIGLSFKDYFESAFSSTIFVSFMFIVTGSMLWLAARASENTDSTKNISDIAVWKFLIIGICQGIAITPGISRSGITIAVALMLGFDKETAFKYSMLLSVPAIIGAALLEINKISFNNTGIFAGFFTASLTGILALGILSKLVITKKIHIFSYYLWLLGITGIVVYW
ncbi:MAG: Undecaprenyl-diphosphatase [Elusimicrobia bacterium ADurb.Bin231]|nr:MAG: Undecaprenyl-diphosphatase [Elusimicrobia bacterium ADurb.Bin231]